MKQTFEIWVLLALLSCGHCEVINVQLYTTLYDPPVIEFAKFGFEGNGTGGSISLNISHSSTEAEGKVMFFICQDAKYELLTQASILSDECGHLLAYPRCLHSISLPRGTYTFNSDVDSATYHFFIANCERLHLNVSIQGVFLNKVLGHFSTETAPLLYLYPVLAGIWGLFLLAFIGNSCHFHQYRINLHRLFLVVVLLKFLVHLAHSLEIHSIGREGVPISKKSAWWVSGLLETIWQGLFFTFLLLLSKGWSITRPGLFRTSEKTVAQSFQVTYFNNSELKAIVVHVSFIVIAYFCHQFVSEFFEFGYIVIFVGCIKYSVSSIAYNVKSLDSQLDLIEEHQEQNQVSVIVTENESDSISGNNQHTEDRNSTTNTSTSTVTQPTYQIDTTPIKEKLLLFKRVQAVTIGFLFVRILEVIIIKFFLENTPWAQVMFQDLLQIIVVCLGIGSTIRLRKFFDPATLVRPETPKHINGKKLPTLIVIENPPTCAIKKNRIRPKHVIEKLETPRRLVPSVQFGTIETYNVFSNS